MSGRWRRLVDWLLGPWRRPASGGVCAPLPADVFGRLGMQNYLLPYRVYTPFKLGVTDETLRVWAAAGLEPEDDSPLHAMLLAFDDAGLPARDALFRAAQQIHALTPLAACRSSMPTMPLPPRET